MPQREPHCSTTALRSPVTLHLHDEKLGCIQLNGWLMLDTLLHLPVRRCVQQTESLPCYGGS